MGRLVKVHISSKAFEVTEALNKNGFKGVPIQSHVEKLTDEDDIRTKDNPDGEMTRLQYERHMRDYAAIIVEPDFFHVTGGMQTRIENEFLTPAEFDEYGYWKALVKHLEEQFGSGVEIKPAGAQGREFEIMRKTRKAKVKV